MKLCNKISKLSLLLKIYYANKLINS